MGNKDVLKSMAGLTMTAAGLFWMTIGGDMHGGLLWMLLGAMYLNGVREVSKA